MFSSNLSGRAGAGNRPPPPLVKKFANKYRVPRFGLTNLTGETLSGRAAQSGNQREEGL